MSDRNERPKLPDLTRATLEKAFPRTFACLSENERVKVARDFSQLGEAHELRRFPGRLAGRKWSSGKGFVADLAQLEYLLRVVILAPEVERAGFEAVATAGEPEWYHASFRFDPAHRILESDWPLDRIYPHPQGEHSPHPGTFLIYRSQGKALFRPLGLNEAHLIHALRLGVPLGRVLERPRGPDFDAMTFHRWIETGLLRAIDWASV